MKYWFPASSSFSLRSFLHCGAPVSHGKIIVGCNHWPVASIFTVGPVKLNKDRPVGPVDILGTLGPVGWIKRLFSNLDGDWQKVLLFNLQSYGGKRILTFQKEKLKEVANRPVGPVDILGPLGPATFVSSVSFNID
jgi:hypothetical protein